MKAALGLVFAAMSLVFLPAVAAAQDTRTETVRFARGASGTTISDSIRGYESVDYRIGVSAGQTMSVDLQTSNASNYFNITAPGASEALFIGSISGTDTIFEIPSSGTYTISVYLMRNAARRNETANYDLSIAVRGSASSQTQAPSQTTAPDFADGLAGGPDYWQVTGLSAGDTLNVRQSASTGARLVGRLSNGDIVHNLGCAMSGGNRWCQIETTSQLVGWVAGRYLHESFGNAHEASTLPAHPAKPLPVRPAATIDTSLMPRFCKGEASAKYGVRPQEITTNLAYKSGDRYVSQGYFDDGDDTTFFNCWFTADGEFAFIS